VTIIRRRIVPLTTETDETAILTVHSDFVIIGAGSAGCVVARVLAEAGFRVILVEPGPKTPADRTPANYINLFGSRDDWGFETVPQKNLANRKIRYPLGRGFGGSSRINAMIWYPPTATELQKLAAVGGFAWSTGSLSKSFAEVEQWVRPESPLYVAEVSKRFLTASASLAIPNSLFARMTREGFRRTAADVLDESRAKDRVTKVTAKVQRILFDRNAVSGVEILAEDAVSPERLEVNRAVILCAGAIHSPAILFQSGIGTRDDLMANNTVVIHEHPDVGLNLSDHLIMPVIFATTRDQHFPIAPTANERFSNLAEAGGLVRKDDAGLIQFHVTPTHYLSYPNVSATAAMTVGVNGCQPYSRGRLRFTKSKQPSHWNIEIDPGFLNDSRDVEAILAGVELARSIAAHPDVSSVVVDELIPGSKRQSPEAILRSIQRFAQTLYHPTGTCRMGSDSNSVVDEQLAVRGVEGLHVIDASVLPTIPTVNPNATVMMLAMHSAKFLIDRYQ